MAYASIQVNLNSREVLLGLVALVGLCVVVLLNGGGSQVRRRPVGRRSEDLARFLGVEEDAHEEESKGVHWHPPHISLRPAWNCALPVGYDHWYISIFNAWRRGGNKIFAKKGHQHLVCENDDELELLLEPIVYNISKRYPKLVHQNNPLHLIRKAGQNSRYYSWITSELHMHKAIYSFLDECLRICEQFECEADLRIISETGLSILLEFERKQEILQLEELSLKNPEIEFMDLTEKVHLRLWLAFTSENIPEHMKNIHIPPVEFSKRYRKIA